MANGKTATITKVLNNKQSTTVTNKIVEAVVVNGTLVPDNNEVNAGVNSNSNKN